MQRKTAIVTMSLFFILAFSTAALAADEALAPEVQKFIALAAGLGIAIAVFGGALGQARAATAALEGIARNPSAYQKIFTPMILSLALIESLVIYALVISFLLVFKI